jgi:ABC-type polar amino acid transport system ATPase subunit
VRRKVTAGRVLKELDRLEVPVADVSSLFGMGASGKGRILKAVRELEKERDEEAAGSRIVEGKIMKHRRIVIDIGIAELIGLGLRPNDNT